VVQLVRLPLVFVASVAPPESESRGEKIIESERVHETEPGAPPL
jgi:hypothetical protein